MRLLLIGECMVELGRALPNNELLLKSGFSGDTANTAWYLAQLRPDWCIQYLTDVGTDRLSSRMIAFLNGSGIRTDFVAQRDDKTVGIYLIEVDEHGERSFVYWRGESAARSLADDHARLENALDQADAIYFSGITLAILQDDDRTRLLDSIARSAASDRQVIFDPNIRPKLWNDHETMRKALMAAAGISSIVLPSFDDEKVAFGDASPDATIQRYRDAGVAEVVVKNGADMIHACCPAGRFVHTPSTVTVVDTTAAGDSFNAGYLCARLSGEDVATALSLGARISGCVVGEPGALVKIQRP